MIEADAELEPGVFVFVILFVIGAGDDKQGCGRVGDLAVGGCLEAVAGVELGERAGVGLFSRAGSAATIGCQLFAPMLHTHGVIAEFRAPRVSVIRAEMKPAPRLPGRRLTIGWRLASVEPGAYRQPHEQGGDGAGDGNELVRA